MKVLEMQRYEKMWECILTLRLTAGVIRRHGCNSCKSFGLVADQKSKSFLPVVRLLEPEMPAVF